MKRLLMWLSLGGLVVFFVWKAGFLDGALYYHFNSHRWSEATPSQRYFMAEFLCDNDLLSHKSKEDVIKTLGPPTEDYSNWIFYELGKKRLLMLMEEDPRLIIKFDASRTVSRTSIDKSMQ